MKKEIWALPFPSSCLDIEPTILELPRRELELSFSLYDDDDQSCKFVVKYFGVEGFKWTYLTSCDIEMIQSAYDKLIDCGDTEWLISCQEISTRMGKKEELHHFRIFFDDGPCLDVISVGVAID
jgi:hypothetical protein